jgi:thiol:disulfide interchange protein DsbD
LRFFLSTSWFFLTIATAAVATPAIEPPLPMDQAFRLEAHRDGPDVALRWQLEDGYYLYRDYLSAIGSDGTPVDMATRPGVIKDDPGFGSTEVYYGTATAGVSAPTTGTVKVTYQGCQDGGLCYPPATVEISSATLAQAPGWTAEQAVSPAPQSSSAFPFQSKAAPVSDGGPTIRIADQSKTGVVGSLLDRGGVALLIAGFLGLGLLLAFTPCVFPMYPILAAALSREGETLSAKRGFAVSLVYVLSLAAAFSLFGVAAAWWGQGFQVALQSTTATVPEEQKAARMGGGQRGGGCRGGTRDGSIHLFQHAGSACHLHLPHPGGHRKPDRRRRPPGGPEPVGDLVSALPPRAADDGGTRRDHVGRRLCLRQSGGAIGNSVRLPAWRKA